jgi:tRNA-specific 2-thiouridylase
LCNLNQSQLKRALFPIGHLTKEIVRKQAAAFNLPSYTRKDSQGICFLGNFKFSDFIRHHLGEKEGNIREFETHKKLGSHQGHWFYTIGQRHGISLSGGPWYVVEKEASTNTVFVSHTYHNLEEQRTRFTLAQSMWIPGFDPCQTSLLVKVRHRTLPQTCTISQINEKNYCVKLADKDQGIAPGQYAVFYERDLCVGQGIIV